MYVERIYDLLYAYLLAMATEHGQMFNLTIKKALWNKEIQFFT